MRGACGFELRPGCGKYLQHFTEDEQARLPRLFQRLRHHLGSDSLDLDIHLQGGDALVGTGHFEIHITQVVFSAQDIGQDAYLSVTL